MSLEKVYQQVLLDHYHHPRHKGALENATAAVGIYNASCGDQVCMQLQIENNQIVALMFEGKGCVISLAVASMLAEKLHKSSVHDALALTSHDMIKLVGVPLGPTRLRCALLALESVQAGIAQYQSSL